RARRGGDGRPRRARRAGRDRGAGVASRPLPLAQLGARGARRRRVARLLAQEARVPRHLARPAGQARRARDRLGRRRRRVRLPASRRRPPPPRTGSHPVVARAPVQGLIGAGFLAALLAADHFASFHEQLALGALTWAALVLALARTSTE